MVASVARQDKVPAHRALVAYIFCRRTRTQDTFLVRFVCVHPACKTHDDVCLACVVFRHRLPENHRASQIEGVAEWLLQARLLGLSTFPFYIAHRMTHVVFLVR